MKPRKSIYAAGFAAAALLAMAPSANAATIIYNTVNTTGFGGASLTLDSSSGNAATLAFVTVGDTLVTVPSNIAYGFFTVACPTCTGTSGATFDPFTFDMIITDVNSGATGTFIGTSSGGNILSNSSNLTIAWAPNQIGPGTQNATSLDFGPTRYTNEAVTNIVAPNTGFPVGGVTTVQGFGTTIPEPGSVSLLGGALLCLGFWRQRRRLAGK